MKNNLNNNWYKTAQNYNFDVWLANEILKLTNNFKQQPHSVFKDIIKDPKKLDLIRNWSLETHQDLEGRSLLTIYQSAKIYYENKNKTSVEKQII